LTRSDARASMRSIPRAFLMMPTGYSHVDNNRIGEGQVDISGKWLSNNN
jgi:hypothetical protein